LECELIASVVSTDGETLTEASPIRPVSNKGRIRAEMWNELREWHTAGRANTAAVRPATFTKKVALLGDPDVRHTITYTNATVLALVTA
jgi:hypothetical protein